MDDREKLIELIEQAWNIMTTEALKDVSLIDGRIADHLIANEVVIQKQGEWEESANYDVGFWVCSVCNFTSEATAASKLYKYCPSCGAKMREVK